MLYSVNLLFYRYALANINQLKLEGTQIPQPPPQTNKHPWLCWQATLDIHHFLGDSASTKLRRGWEGQGSDGHFDQRSTLLYSYIIYIYIYIIIFRYIYIYHLVFWRNTLRSMHHVHIINGQWVPTDMDLGNIQYTKTLSISTYCFYIHLDCLVYIAPLNSIIYSSFIIYNI